MHQNVTITWWFGSLQYHLSLLTSKLLCFCCTLSTRIALAHAFGTFLALGTVLPILAHYCLSLWCFGRFVVHDYTDFDYTSHLRSSVIRVTVSHPFRAFPE